MFRNILIPTDGSPLATLAVDKGIEFARDIKAGVIVVTVIEPFHLVSGKPDQVSHTRSEYEAIARTEAARALTDAELKASQVGVPLQSVQVESNEPFQAIIDATEMHHCDLIMMASHGRRGISALLLGSVTQKVLTHSRIPVLVYR